MKTDSDAAGQVKQIAEEACKSAVRSGASHVIVMVYEEESGKYYAAWAGEGLAARGLLESGAEILRKKLYQVPDTHS